MGNETCVQPKLFYDFSNQVCEAEPVTTAPAIAAPASLPPIRLAATGATSAADSLERHRRRLALQAFPESSAAASSDSLFNHSPLALSAWSLLPAACSPNNPDTGSGGGSGDGGSDSSSSGDAPTVVPPRVIDSSMIYSTPCGADGTITDLEEGWGVCANWGTGNHHLFRWNPLGNGSAVSEVPLSYPPDQMLMLGGGEILISMNQSPSLILINPDASHEGPVFFPTSLAVSGTSSSGRSVGSVTPSMPKGMISNGERVFIATSNYDEAHSDYLPGTVLIHDLVSGGFTHLNTSGFNPTSLAISDGVLLVVNSGAIDRNGVATTLASLDVFDPNSGSLLRTVPLGVSGAGLGGEMALSADGSRLVIPTADNSGRILSVDLTNLTVGEINLRSEGVSGSRIFFSSLQVSPDGRYAWIGNFNDGKVYTIDLHNGHRVEAPLVVDSNTADALGLGDSLLLGRDLYIGKGPEIWRIQYQ